MTYTPHPLRFQRKRTKGWRMPPGGVCCTRPGILGNPFAQWSMNRDPVDRYWWWITGVDGIPEFRQMLRWERNPSLVDAKIDALMELRCRVLQRLPSLRGKPLGCFCGLDQPCHVDVICELANPVEQTDG